MQHLYSVDDKILLITKVLILIALKYYIIVLHIINILIFDTSI